MMDSRRSTSDWIYEGISTVALIAAIADVAMHWKILPAQIPTHFGSAGAPNGWGDKNRLLFLLATTVGVAILLTVAESYQRLINIPIKVDRESPEVRRLLRSMVIVMKVAITVSFLWIVDLTMKTALGEANGLGRDFTPIFLGGVFLPVIFYVVKLART